MEKNSRNKLVKTPDEFVKKQPKTGNMNYPIRVQL